MTNIAKSLLLLASAVMLILPTACKDRDTDPTLDTNSDGQIRLGVSGDLVTTKVPGVITGVAELTENVAVYATTFTTVDGKPTLTWPADPLIGTNSATVNTTSADPAELGELIYYTDKPTPFPEQTTAVYALFPCDEAAGVKVTYTEGNGPIGDPATTVKGGPQADVKLKTTPAEQYDILYATISNLRREQLMNKQKAKIVFNHTLAQLKFRVYADMALSGPMKLTKVVVNADSEGKLLDTLGVYTSVGAPVDMIMYNDVAIDIPITNTPPATANIPTNLMLFPSVEMASFKSVTLTINGQEYKLDIKTPGFNLEKGKINIVTLKMTPLGLKLDEMAAHTIEKWLVGEEINGSTNVVNYKTAMSLKMQNSKIITDAAYTTSGAMTAEVQINESFWLEHTNVDKTKTKRIPCNFSAGVLAFNEQEPTLMLSDDPVYLTHLRIFDNGTLIFDAAVPKGEILIPKTASGALEYVARPGTALMVNMLFGGFGEGSAAYPYKVSSLDLLKRLQNFTSTSDLAIDYLNFKQTANVDLQNTWTPIGSTTTPFYGSYDGSNFTLENLKVSGVADAGLFGAVGQTSTTNGVAKFTNINVTSGSVSSTNMGGVIVGNLLGAASFENVHNKGVTVTAPSAGGIVGNVLYVSKSPLSATFINCSNAGTITSGGNSNSTDAAGGIVGLSGAQVATKFTNCHNTGDINTMYNGGGMIGRMGLKTWTISIDQCSNKGNVTGQASAATMVGGLIGQLYLNPDAATVVTIQNSFNSGAITGQSANVGGLVGLYRTSSYGNILNTIKGCYNTGLIKVAVDITPGSATENGAGGLIGQSNLQASNKFAVENCYVAAEVQTQSVSKVRTAYLIGIQRTAPPLAAEVRNCYFNAGLSIDNNRDKYGSALTETLPSTDLKTQEGLDLINTGTAYYKLNSGGFPKLLWEK